MPTQTPVKKELFASTLKRISLGVLVGVLGFVVLTGVITPQKTAAATSDTVNFQAKLMTNTGAIAADGNYNVEFNLYSASSGGTALWTETYLNSASNGIRVKNGYLVANLGSVNPFPSNINWDQNLYIGMTVRGTASCSFGSCSPTDGEMTPRLKLTAVPFAFSAGDLANISSGGFQSTLSFQGATGGDQDFVIPDLGAAASDTVCLLSLGNCAGTGGGIAGFGLQNYISKFDTSGGNHIGVSSIYDDGSFVGINTTTNNGLLTIQGASTTQSGVFIQGHSSATAATAVIKQGSSQTGNLLEFQDSSGNVNGSINATGNVLQLGRAAGSGTVTQGKLQLADGTTDGFLLTLQSGTLTANSTVTIPDAGGADTVCLYTLANCVGAGGGITGSGTQNYLTKFNNLGGTTIGNSSLYDNGTFLGLNTTTDNGLFSLVGASATQSSLFVQGAASGSVAASIIQQGSGATANTLELQDSSSNVQASFNATGNVLTLGNNTGSGTSAGSLQFTDGTSDGFFGNISLGGALSGNQSYVLPLTGGTFCMQGSSTCGFESTSGNDFIQNQTASSQTADFKISGTGTAASYIATTSVLTSLLDTASSGGTLAIGTTNATGGINLQQNVTLAVGKNITFASGSGSFDQSASSGTFKTGTGTVSLNGATTANAGITITNAGGLATQKGTDYSTTGSQNDVSFGAASLYRLTGASAQTITGIAGGVDGRQLTLVNAGSNAAILKNNDTTDSLAANVIITGTGTDLSLPAGGSITLVYDSGANVWRVNGTVPTPSSGVTTVGAISGTSNANGATITGSTINLTVADATNGGVVSNTTQTFAGLKTFQDGITAANINTTAGQATSLGNSTGALTITGNSSSTFVINGSTIDATEFTLLDGKDAPLVDTNDAVATAITGTGTLTTGSINWSGAITTSGNISTTGTGTITSAGLLTASGGLTAANINTTAAQATNLGNSTGAFTVTGNSSSTFVVNGVTVDATEFNRLDGKDAALVDTNDAVATAITGTGVLASGSINWSGNIATSGNISTSGTGTITSAGVITANGGVAVSNTGSLATQKGTDFSTTGSSNDVNFGAGSLYRLTGASAQTITGIAGGTDGRQLTLVNAASTAAVLKNNDTTDSSASNVIITGSGSDMSLPAGGSITLIYDAGANVWRVNGGAATTAAPGVNTVGAINGTSNANGATISGTTLNLSAADATNGGVVSNTTQTFAGDKTFAGLLTGNAGLSITSGAVNLQANAASQITTSSGNLTLDSAATLQLGATNATAITIGHSGVTTTIQGDTAITLSGTTGTTMVCQNGGGVLSSCDASYLAPTAGNFIQNQTASTQTAGFKINGTGTADSFVASTSFLGSLLDTNSATALNLGTTNATVINLNQSTTLAAGKSLSFAAGAGNFDLHLSTGTFQTGTGNISLNGDIAIGNGKSITFGTSGNFDQSASSGSFKTGTGAVSLNGATTANSGLTITNAGSLVTQKGTDFSTTGSSNDVAFGSGSLYRLNGASAQTITGIAGGVDGRILTLVNAGTTTATLKNNDTTDSSASNVIITGTGGDLNLTAGSSIALIYDSGASLWRVTGSTAASGGAGVNTVGSLNGGTANAAGATIAGTTIFLQSASTSNAGLVDTTTQSFQGQKTFATGITAGSINTTAGANTVLGNSTGTFSILSQGGLNVTTGGAVTGVSTLATSGIITVGALGTTGTALVCTNASNQLSTCSSTYETTTGTDFIQNQNASTQTANFKINGTGTADTYVAVTALQAPLLDTASAVALNIGTTNATAINLNQSTTIAAGKNITFASGAGNFDQSASSGSFKTGTGNISLNGDTTIAAGKSITITGSGTRPASPTEGMLYYDTTNKELLVYQNSKWQADRQQATLVAANNSSQAEKDSADFVASGTGDQSTLASALADADPAGSGRKTGDVYLFPGTYNVSNVTSIPDNVTLEGAGTSSIIKFSDIHGTTRNMLTNTDTSGATSTGIVIRNLFLDGNNSVNTTGTQYGIAMITFGQSLPSNVEGVTITGVTVANFHDRGISLSPADFSTVSESAAYGNDVGIYANGSRATIVNNSIHNNSSQGILFVGSLYSVVSNNKVTNNAVEGIALTGNSSDNNVSNNVFRANGGSTTNNAIYLVSSDTNNITNNDVSDTNCSSNCYAINISDVASEQNFISGNSLGFSPTIGTINNLGYGTVFSNQVDGSGSLINKSAGYTIGANAATNSLTLQGGLTQTQLPAPAAGVVTNVGTPGSTTYRYQITALDGFGETLPSTIEQTTTGPATLNGTSYNTITWNSVGGALSYNIYRCSGSSSCTPTKLTNVSGYSVSYNDQGGTASGALPGSNTTGGALFAGTIQAPALERSTAGTLSIGTTANTTGINFGNLSATLTITGNSSSTFVINGTTVDATEFNRLDGKDAALVDVNDAVSTAIVGTGALNAGSITSGFGSIDTGADNITTTGTVAGGTVTIATTGSLDTSAAGALNIGLTSGGNATSINLNQTTTANAGITLSSGGSLATQKGTDYSTTGTADASFGSASLYRLTGASAQTISGIVGGVDGRLLTVVNAGTTAATLLDQGSGSASATAARRIVTGTGSDISLPAGASIQLIYDSGASRWRVTSGVAASGGVGVNTIDAISGTSNANGATISGTHLALTAADGTNGGVVTNAAQTLAGLKTFQDGVTSTNINTTAAQATNLGNSTGALTVIGNSSSTFVINGSTVDATEFTRLDGKDAALVDTNDAVATAITGTGALTTGSINWSGAVTTSGNISTTGTGTITSAGLLTASGGLTATNINTTAAQATNIGNTTGVLTVTGNSSSTFVINGITVDATEFNRLDGKDAALVDTNDAVATAITGTGALTTGSINWSGNIATSGNISTSGTGTITSAGTITANGGVLVANTGSLTTQKGTDYSTTGTADATFGSGSLYRLTGASSQTISGIAGGVDGRILTLVNAGTTTATLVDQSSGSTSSTAANRITTGTGADVALPAGSSITLIYDSGASRWRLTGSTAASGGSGVNTIGSISGTSTANGATITGTTLNLTVANGTNGGVLSAAGQTIGGLKTFQDGITSGSINTTAAQATSLGNSTGALTITGNSSSTFVINGSTVDATEFTRLDGKDAALVDTNDAVATAITGTGALTTGSINWSGAIATSGNISTSGSGTITSAGLLTANGGLTAANINTTAAQATNLGNTTGAFTVTGNSSSTFVVNGVTVDATEFNRLDGKDAALVDTNDAVATAITGTGALTTGSINWSGNIATSGNISTSGTGTITAAGLITASGGLTATNVNTTAAQATNLGNTTGVLTITGNSSSTFVINGSTVDATEFNRLDGKDAALVDTNDAVATAITGTGALTTGSINWSGAIATSGNISTSGTGTITSAGLLTASGGLTATNINTTAAQATNLGNTTGAFTVTGNSSSTFVINGVTVDATEFNRLDGKDAALVDTNDAVATAITGTGALTTGSINWSGNIATSGNISTSGTGTITSAGIITANAGVTVANTGSLSTSAGTTYTTAGAAANDLAISTASFYILDTSGAAQVINSIAAGRDGQHLTLTNTDTTNAVTLVNNGTGTNKIITGTGVNIDIPVGGSVSLIFDSANARWRVVGSTAAAGGVGVNTIDAISATSNSKGATITGTHLALTAADGTNGGVVTNVAQTFAGLKTFQDGLTSTNINTTAAQATNLGNSTGALTVTGNSSSTFVINGSTVDATEFTRLDGKDAALVDTNDAVATAITGTGALTTGSINWSGAIATSGNISTSGSGTITSAGLLTANGGLTAANINTTAAQATNLGNTTGAFTVTGNSSSTFVVNGVTVDATEFNRLDGKDAALVDTNDAVATAITGTGALTTGSINWSGNIATSGNISTSGTGTITAAGLITASGGLTATNVNTTAAQATNLGNTTGTLTITGNSSSTFVINGSTVDATEFNRLDGKDAALVDTNDAVATAITGTGALTTGSINWSGNIATSGNISTSGSGTITSAGLITASGGLTATNINTTAAQTTNLGNATGTLTITGNSSSTFVINGSTVDATEFNRLDGKDAALVDTNDAVATAITGTGALTTGSINWSGNIATSGNISTSGTGTITSAGLITANAGVTVANTGSLSTTSGTTYTTAGAAANDLAISTASFYVLDTTGAAQVINSIAAGRDGQHLTLTNNDTTNAVTLVNNGTGTNKIITGTNSNIDIPVGGSVSLIYDLANTRWRVVGSSAASGGVGVNTIDAISATSNSKGATITGTHLALTAADGTNGGVVTNVAQTFAGLKTFQDGLTSTNINTTAAQATSLGNSTGALTITGNSSSTFVINGSTVDATEFTRLDGKDAALVDTNDAVATAITGTGALTTGSINWSGAIATSGNISTTGSGTITAAGLLTANGGLTAANINTTAAQATSLGNSTGAFTVTGNSSSTFVVNGITVDATEFNRLDGKDAALVDTNDAVATAITGTGALTTGSINWSGNIATSGNISTSGTGTITAAGLITASGGLTATNVNTTAAQATNLGNTTGVLTVTGNSSTTFVINGSTVDATEFNRLDGKDAALVDTNDAVATAITGTGALTTGSINWSGAIATSGNISTSGSGTITSAGLITASGGLTATNINTTAAQATNLGNTTGTLTVTGNSSSTFVINGSTVDATEFNRLDGKDAALVDTNDAVATAITGTGALTTGSINWSGNIATSGNISTSGTGTITSAGVITANGGITVANTGSLSTTSGTTYTTAGAATNDLAISTASFYVLDTTGATQVINSIAAGRDGQHLTLTNNDTTNPVTLVNNGTGTNKIITGTGVNMDIPVGGSVSLIYDLANTRWRVVGSAAASGGVGVNTIDAISATSNSKGATITGTHLALTAADGTNGGVVTNVAQTFAGLKTFQDGLTSTNINTTAAQATSLGNSTGVLTVTGNSSSTFVINGSTVDATEFTRLDGKDAALVDTNDAVATAITGTGALTTGSINWSGAITTSGNISTSGTGTITAAGLLTANGGLTAANINTTAAQTTNLGNTTGAFTVTGNSSSTFVVNGVTVDATEFNRLDGKDAALVDTNDAVATAITGTGALTTGSINWSGNIATSGNISTSGTGTITAAGLITASGGLTATNVNTTAAQATNLGNTTGVLTITGNSSSTFVINGSTVDATEFNRLDGKDAALVDTNDAVATAITGTGALTTGSINWSGAIATSGNISTSGTGTITSAGLLTASGGLTAANINTTAAQTTSLGNTTGAFTVTGNSSSTFVINGVTVDATEFNRLDGKDAALVDTNDAVATAITGTGALTTGSINWSGNIATSGNISTSGTGTITSVGVITANGGITVANTGSLSTTSGTTYTTAGAAANDVALSTASFYVLDTTGAAQIINSIAAGRDGQHLTLTNNDTTNVVTLVNNGTGTNKIITGTGSNMDIPVGGSVSLIYDLANVRWRVVGSAAAAGGVGVNTVDAISATSNSKGATITGTHLALTAADGTNGGVVTNVAQTFAGLKTFQDGLTSTNINTTAAQATSLGNSTGALTITGNSSSTFVINGSTVDATEFTRLDGKDAALVDTNDAVATAITGTGALTTGSINWSGAIATSGNISTSGSGTITSAGLLTANGGLTAANINTTAAQATNLGNSTGAFTVTGNSSSTFVVNGITVDATEFNRLDGKDAALVDTNDAVATAITGTGALTTGSINWSGNIATSGNISTSGTGTITAAGLITASGGLTATNVNTTAAQATNLGNTTGVLTITGNSSSTFVINGSTVDATEFNRLDGKDAALVDTNDAVATAITGTGALTTGSINWSGNIATSGNISTSGTGTITSAGLLTASGGLTATNINTTAAQATNLGNTTGAFTVTGNSSSTFVINGITVDATEFNRLDGKDAALVDTNDAVATAITGTGALTTGSINWSGAITTSGNISTSGTGTISSAGLITASSGVTLTNGGSLTTQKGTDYSAVGQQDNINFGSAGLYRITSATALTITGIANGADGKQLTLVNASANAVTINNNDTAHSSSTNVIITGTGGNTTFPSGSSLNLIYDATSTAWRIVGSASSAGGAGVNAIGTYSSSNHYSDGGSISGTTLTLGSADATHPGLVDTSAQTFAGAKTFSALITGNAGISTIGGAVSLQGSTASTFTTTSGNTTVDSAAALQLGNSTATSIAIGQSGITTTITGGLTQLTGAFSLQGNAASALTTSSGGLTIDTITTAGQTIAIGNSNITHTIQIGTASGSAQTVTVGSTNSASTTTLQGGSSSVNVTDGGVGIGTASPTTNLQIVTNNTVINNPQVNIQQTGNGDSSIQFSTPSSSYYVGVDTSNNSSFSISSNLSNGSTSSFGYKTIGGSTDTADRNTLECTKFNATSTGTISSMSIFIGAIDPTPANDLFQLAVYSNSGSAPNTLLGNSLSATLAANSWNSATLSVPVTLGTTYWLCYNTNGSATGYNNFKYDTNGSVNQSNFVAHTYGSWPATYSGGTFWTPNTARISIYANIGSAITDEFSHSLLNLTDAGAATFQNSVDSNNAFQVQNAAGTNSVFNVDTTANRVGINLATGATATADLSFGVGNRTINILQQTTNNTAGGTLTVNSGQGLGNGAGGLLTVQSGQGGATGAGGALTLQGGAGGATSGAGGLTTLSGGNATAGNSAGGGVTIQGGAATGTGAASAVSITAGSAVASGAGNAGGALGLTAGNAAGTGANAGGAITLIAGNSSATGTGNGGAINLQGGTGSGTNTIGGALGFTAGAGNGNQAGGAIVITGGTAGATGSGGAVTIKSGNAAGGAAGAVTVDTGTSFSGSSLLNLGNTNATGIQIGHGTIATTITGNVGITNTNATTALAVSTNTTPTTAALVVTDTTNTTTDKLLSLQSGSTPTAKFTVDAAGNVVALGSLTTGSSGQFSVASNGDVTNSGKYNTDTLTSTALTFGTSSSAVVGLTQAAASTAGGNLTLQGGQSGSGAVNGGDLLLQGGSTGGTGVQGLVKLSTSAFTTAGNQNFTATAGSVTLSNVDGFSAVDISANAAGYTESIPAPTVKYSGRLLYLEITGSNSITLNPFGGTSILMNPGTAVTLVWNTNTNGWLNAGADSGSNSYIQNQTGTTQTAGFKINGAGTVGGLFTASAGIATSGGTFSLSGNASSTITTTAGNTSVDAFAILNLGTSTATSIAIGHGTINTGITGTVSISNTSATTDLSISTTVNPTTGVIVANIANGAAAGNLLNLQNNGASKFTVDANGNVVSANSATTATTGFTLNSTNASGTQTSGFDVQHTAAGTLTNGYDVNATAGTVTNGVNITTNGGTVTNGVTIGNTTGTLTHGINLSGTIGSDIYRQSGSLDLQAGTDGANAIAFENSQQANALSVDTSNTGSGLNLATNGGGESGATNWTAFGASTVTQDTIDNPDSGVAVIKAATLAANRGAKYAITLTSGTTYSMSFAIKSSTGSPTLGSTNVYYSTNGTSSAAACTGGSFDSVNIATSFVKYTCSFTATSSSAAFVVISQGDATSRTLYIDNLAVVPVNATGTQNTGVINIGGGAQGQGLVLLKLDTNAGTPFTGANASLAGAMYFDTTAGKMQCYDGTVWGACGAAPNTLVTITPEYAGAVLDGTGVGTLTSDFCSNEVGILVVGTLCATHDARNFYKWNSPQATAQTYNMYVTYKLPATFKAFVSGSTSMTGLVDSTSNADVKYAIFKKSNSGGALAACSTTKSVITGAANSWWTTAPTTDPATGTGGCAFSPNDSIIFQISVVANSNANAYAENLNFQFSNQ